MKKHSKIWLTVAAVVSGITIVCATVVMAARFITSNNIDAVGFAAAAWLPVGSLLVHIISILKSGGKDTLLANIMYKILSVVTLLVSAFTILISIQFVQIMLNSW